MANHKSADKRNRQNTKRRARNFSLRSRMRGEIKLARAAIEQGAEDKDEQLKRAVRRIYKTASKSAIDKRTASRFVSRLMKAAAKA